jgi:D-alanyl-D-alanine carboxypeptidase
MTVLLRQCLFVLLVCLMVLAAPVNGTLVAQSQENTRYAAIVIDAQTGEPLFVRHADDRRYPASLTKMMTLYLTFEALQQGRVRTTDVLTVSRHAASMPPSKLGLAAGQTITLDDAMRATAIRSANDMAVAIAEHIGGSEDRFASLMTAKARQLGMNNTRFVNANGLPDSRQATTARDMATLSLALMRDFPQYYSYMGQHDWVYNGREYRNTNGLLREGRGYDGLKTGYIRDSGYNLAASAVRDGRRLVTVVMGGRSVPSRNAHVAELTETGFELEALRARGQGTMLAQAFFEQRGFGISRDNTQVQYASLDRDENQAEDDDAAINSRILTASTPIPYAEARTSLAFADLPPPAAVPPAQRQAEAQGDITGELNVATTPRQARRPATPTRSPAPPAGRWAVQVGAFRDESVARGWLGEVNRRFRSQFNGVDRTVQAAEGWYRSRFTGLTEEAARGACAALSERRVTCMVVRPD